MILLRPGPLDLLRCRLAVSPLFELGAAVRTTHLPESRRWHLPWLESIPSRPGGLALVQALQPARGYTPDFLAPTPTGTTAGIEDELERVARTPLDDVVRELERCRGDQPDAAARSVLDGLLDDPEDGRAQVVAALRSCWDVLLAPHWPRVRQLLDADVAHRARQLADRGLLGLLADLHPDVRYADGAVQVRWRRTAVVEARDLDGDGLVLMPSAFTWPDPVAVLDLPWQPTIVYPARGIAELWQRRPVTPDAALAGVLGGTRARLLTDLGESASTTALAARYGLAPSTLSRHLTALTAAGLLQARRDRRQVLYERTRLGTALCRGPS